MTEPPPPKDLVCLVADKNMEQAVEGLLSRHHSLDIRPLRWQTFVHPERDPGCYQHGHELLRSQRARYQKALMLFDLEGCGQEDKEAARIEDEVRGKLFQNGWEEGSAEVVVVVPELEAWVWSESPEVDRLLGWSGRLPGLRDWLQGEGFLVADEVKPKRPKEAMESALYQVRKPRSAATYRRLAESVSLRGCCDRSFRRLVRILRGWFPRGGG